MILFRRFPRSDRLGPISNHQTRNRSKSIPKKLSKKAKSQRHGERALLEKVHLNAAGIDVGAATHWVAVPEDRDENPVRSFGVFTSDLIALCEWLKRCHIETIAMESTGVYWIPLFQVLERNGFKVRLVNASHAKNVPGRKTDVKDCQWLQQLHTFGMLRGSFRPEGKMCVVRSYLRLRDTLSKDCNSLVQRMQKALTEMNIQIHRVISDITGVTGMSILRAILAGGLRYRELAGLCTTLKGWLEGLDGNDRLYPPLNPLGAATGRFSCPKPNLLAVPRNSDVRGCFIPDDPELVLVEADFSPKKLITWKPWE